MKNDKVFIVIRSLILYKLLKFMRSDILLMSNSRYFK